MMSVVYFEFMPNPENLGQLLQMRAQSYPTETALRYTKDNKTMTMDYASLHRNAKFMAGAIEQIVPARAKAILMYDNDKDYLCALFACIYAGVTAIPMGFVNEENDMTRLEKIIMHTKAQVLLSSENGMRRLGKAFWESDCAQSIWPLTSDFSVIYPRASVYYDRTIEKAAVAIIDYVGHSVDDTSVHYITHHELLEQVLGGIKNGNETINCLTPFTQEGMAFSVVASPRAKVTPLRVMR